MKKNSLIRQFVYENDFFWEKRKLSEEQKRLMGVLSDLEEEVRLKFSDDKKTLDLIKRYINALDELNLEETTCLFEQGVKFGIKFGMELAEE